MNEFLQSLEDFFFGGGLVIAKTASVLIFGLILVRILMRLFKNLMIKSKMDKTISSFVNSIIGVGLYFALFMFVGKTAGISTASTVALLGSAGLAVSLALKDSLSNLANGFIIVGSRPFVVGDYIEVAGVGGTVKAIGIFNTKLSTPDNKTITLPNAQIVGNNVVNYSNTPTRRLDVDFTVAYGSDVDLVKSTVAELIDKMPQTLRSPEPQVVLTEYLDSALKFSARIWLPNEAYWQTKFELNESILKAFAEKNIEIPYNRLDVNVLRVDEGEKR